MDLIRSMKLFVRIVELNNFKRAAKDFGLSGPVATQSMAKLEAHLGAKLIVRTTRSIKLTTCGSRYLEGCRDWLEAFDAVEEAMRRPDREVRGTLRIISTIAEHTPQLSDLFHGFNSVCPKVDLECSIVQHSADLPLLNFDLAVVPGPIKGSEQHTVHALSHDPLVCVAASAYIKKRGVPLSPNDLLDHLHVALSSDVGTSWLFRSNVVHSETLKLRTGYVANNVVDALNAVLGGMGFAFFPQNAVRSGLEAGKLVHILPEHVVSSAKAITSIVVPEKKAARTCVGAFVSFAYEYFDRHKDDFTVETDELSSQTEQA
jgi:DNA-binding transcriptional LysR family regulator